MKNLGSRATAKVRFLKHLKHGVACAAVFLVSSTASLAAQPILWQPQNHHPDENAGVQTDSQSESAQDFSQVAEEAASAHRKGDTRRAVQLYRKGLRQYPEWSQGWRSLGMLLADEGEYAAAVDAFTKLAAIDPKDGNDWALLGLSEFELYRYDDAYRNIQHARSLGIPNADLRNVATFHAALMAILAGDFETAHFFLIDVTRTGADDPDLQVAFGLAALRVSSLPEKLPELPDSQLRNLVARVGQIEFQAAHVPASQTLAAYEKLVQEMPNASKLHYAFGNFLITAARYDEGIAQMKNELALNPADAMAMLQIAMADFRSGQFQDAAAYAEKAVRSAPNLFASHYALGSAYLKLEQIDQAIPELEKAARMAPDSLQCHYALSQAYSKAHRKDDSDRELNTFARLKEIQTKGTQAVVESESGRSTPDRGAPPPQPK